MRPEVRAAAKSWLDRAEADLRAAQADLSAVPPLLEDTLFHCQQAIEKTLKGLPTAQQRRFTKTHDLEQLALASQDVEPRFIELRREFESLSVYASLYRYPGDWQPPNLEDTEKAVSLAREVYDMVSRRVADL